MKYATGGGPRFRVSARATAFPSVSRITRSSVPFGDRTTTSHPLTGRRYMA